MKTVHTVQSFLDTFCQNGLQFRIICACKAVRGANRNRHSVITASWLNSPPPAPTRTFVMSSLLYPPLMRTHTLWRPSRGLLVIPGNFWMFAAVQLFRVVWDRTKTFHTAPVTNRGHLGTSMIYQQTSRHPHEFSANNQKPPGCRTCAVGATGMG